MADFPSGPIEPSFERVAPSIAAEQLAAMTKAYQEQQRLERHAAAAAQDAADTARGQQRPGASAASAKLAELQSSSEWRSKLLAGDGPTRTEFDGLMEAIHGSSRIDAIMDGSAAMQPDRYQVLSKSNPLTARQSVEMVNHLRDAGLSDGTIRQVIEGTPIARAEFDEAKRFYHRLTTSAEWRARVFSGDADAKRQVIAMSIIDICGPADE